MPRLDPLPWLAACELEIDEDLQVEVPHDEQTSGSMLQMPPGTLLPEPFALPGAWAPSNTFTSRPNAECLPWHSLLTSGARPP
ncbi:MAG: hypothetical protein K6T86_05690 [Pirellulales bacterium]|nr:hypothetical protein [Pirellulales bacterium]